jgi:hypothetical protein
MRAVPLSILAPLVTALICGLAGCSKEVKADFPRPPVTASTPPPAPPVAEPPAPEPEEPPLISGAEPDPEDVPAPAPPSRPARRPKPAIEEEASPADTGPPEPPSTQIAGADGVDPEIATKLDRANTLLGSIGKRDLTPEQTEQFTAAKAFVSQAHQALDEGDPRRALVLIDKGLILAQDVERLSRP